MGGHASKEELPPALYSHPGGDHESRAKQVKQLTSFYKANKPERTPAQIRAELDGP